MKNIIHSNHFHFQKVSEIYFLYTFICLYRVFHNSCEDMFHSYLIFCCFVQLLKKKMQIVFSKKITILIQMFRQIISNDVFTVTKSKFWQSICEGVIKLEAKIVKISFQKEDKVMGFLEFIYGGCKCSLSFVLDNLLAE